MKVDIASAREQVLAELRTGDKFLLTTHENPDGDALGSLAAMNEILTQLGKDCVMFMSPRSTRCPTSTGPAARRASRTSYPRRRGAHDRVPRLRQHRPDAGQLPRRDDAHIVNIDHHHDNTQLRHGEPGGGRRVVHGRDRLRAGQDLGAEITPTIADALYVGLVTDTGKFMYENTTPESHRMAAELIEAGWTRTRSSGGCSRTCRSPSCSCWRACWRGPSATTTAG